MHCNRCHDHACCTYLLPSLQFAISAGDDDDGDDGDDDGDDGDGSGNDDDNGDDNDGDDDGLFLAGQNTATTPYHMDGWWVAATTTPHRQ